MTILGDRSPTRRFRRVAKRKELTPILTTLGDRSSRRREAMRKELRRKELRRKELRRKGEEWGHQ